MRKATDLKVGDEVIYLWAHQEVKTSTVVEKPIDKNERPEFGSGRIDLANGDYLIRGASTIYDSVEEANEDLIKKLEELIEIYEGKKDFIEASICIFKSKIRSLKGVE